MQNSISYWRKKRQLRRNKIASDIGTTPQTIEKREKGTLQLSIKRMEKLAPALGVDPFELRVRRDETGAALDPVTKLVDDPEEIALLELWSEVPDDNKSLVLRILGASLDRTTVGEENDLRVRHGSTPKNSF